METPSCDITPPFPYPRSLGFLLLRSSASFLLQELGKYPWKSLGEVTWNRVLPGGSSLCPRPPRGLDNLFLELGIPSLDSWLFFPLSAGLVGNSLWNPQPQSLKCLKSLGILPLDFTGRNYFVVYLELLVAPIFPECCSFKCCSGKAGVPKLRNFRIIKLEKASKSIKSNL